MDGWVETVKDAVPEEKSSRLANSFFLANIINVTDCVRSIDRLLFFTLAFGALSFFSWYTIWSSQSSAWLVSATSSTFKPNILTWSKMRGLLTLCNQPLSLFWFSNQTLPVISRILFRDLDLSFLRPSRYNNSLLLQKMIRTAPLTYPLVILAGKTFISWRVSPHLTTPFKWFHSHGKLISCSSRVHIEPSYAILGHFTDTKERERSSSEFAIYIHTFWNTSSSCPIFSHPIQQQPACACCKATLHFLNGVVDTTKNACHDKYEGVVWNMNTHLTDGYYGEPKCK